MFSGRQAPFFRVFILKHPGRLAAAQLVDKDTYHQDPWRTSGCPVPRVTRPTVESATLSRKQSFAWSLMCAWKAVSLSSRLLYSLHCFARVRS